MKVWDGDMEALEERSVRSSRSRSAGTSQGCLTSGGALVTGPQDACVRMLLPSCDGPGPSLVGRNSDWVDKLDAQERKVGMAGMLRASGSAHLVAFTL